MRFKVGQEIYAYHQNCEVIQVSGGQQIVVGYEPSAIPGIQKPVYGVAGNEVRIRFPDGNTMWEYEDTILFHTD
jgi:hypothetical protein